MRWRAAPAPAPAQSPEPAPAPAPPPAPAPAPPAAPAGFDAVEDFNRVVAAQTSGRVVELTLVRTTVRSEKDAIEFTVRSSHDGYLYVFNHGSDGSLLQLYPNKSSGLPKVRKNVPLNLPKEWDFKISGPSGPNQLLAVVSTYPRDHSAIPARLYEGFSYYPTGDAANALSARHQGPLPWIAGSPKCPSGAACADEFGATVATFNVVQ